MQSPLLLSFFSNTADGQVVALRLVERLFSFCINIGDKYLFCQGHGLLSLHLSVRYSIQVQCHSHAQLCSGIYCLHCGRLPLLTMPYRRLKEAAPLTVLHPADKCVGKPEACWEAGSLCMVSYTVEADMPCSTVQENRGIYIKCDFHVIMFCFQCFLIFSLIIFFEDRLKQYFVATKPF